MHADASQRLDAEPGWSQRVEAFEDAGRRLAALAASGLLTRGLRAVLAHHVIFAFNRADVAVDEQAATAWLGRRVAFGSDIAASASVREPEAPVPDTAQMENDLTAADAADLRRALVSSLINGGHLRTPAVIEAFRKTERHRFIPAADLAAAYADDAVSVKHDETGEMISCISAPSIVATQLEQLDLRPGHRVLEAGAATGYNAALLGQLVAPGGQVWTLDVDQDLVSGAREHLGEAGATNVTVLLGDGAAGLPRHATVRPDPVHRRCRRYSRRDPRPGGSRRQARDPHEDPRQHLPVVRLRTRRRHMEDGVL